VQGVQGVQRELTDSERVVSMMTQLMLVLALQEEQQTRARV